MSFEFCCPQGHVLHGEASQVGQWFQCPLCGSGFLVPPPQAGQLPPGGFLQGPQSWPSENAAGQTLGQSFPPQGGMPGMMSPQMSPYLPGSPEQPASPAESPQESQASAPQGEAPKPRFDLGFDPHAKASLPFELPGQGEEKAATSPPGGLSPPSLPIQAIADGLQGASPSVPLLPAATLLPAGSLPGEGLQDFVHPAPQPELDPPAAAVTEKILHIKCPSGHLVTAGANLLGKMGRCPACKRTFELRYENSVEFRRRRDKILRREEAKSGKAWVAGGVLAAFLVIAGLIAMLFLLNR
jgi:hypothetical protein